MALVEKEALGEAVVEASTEEGGEEEKEEGGEEEKKEEEVMNGEEEVWTGMVHLPPRGRWRG